MAPTQVVITGLGVVSALGADVPAFKAALLAARCGIGPITSIPQDELGEFQTRVAAEIRDFDPRESFNHKDLTLFDRTTQLATLAARQAMSDSGLELRDGKAVRTAVILGTGGGAGHAIEENYRRLYMDRQRRAHPMTVPKAMSNSPVSHITMQHGATGPSFMVSSACASASHAIGVAFQMVRSGMVDIAITGGCEACITVGCFKAWDALRVMAPDTCRPFSKRRLGMCLGEGAAVFVIENAAHARARGARIHARIMGSGMSSDAKDIVLPTVEGPAAAMRFCLEDAGLDPVQIDYINAHGTGTAANDAIETRAVRAAFGRHADKLQISSTKSLHGHALGASGALELLATVLALRDGFVPPTANFMEPDPDCDLDYVPNQARQARLSFALSNSFAFGGHNAVLAVGSHETLQ